MSKLIEMRAALQTFCDREYTADRKPMSANDMKLFAVDCGGYDVTSEVTFSIKDGRFILEVSKFTRADEEDIIEGTFEFKLVE